MSIIIKFQVQSQFHFFNQIEGDGTWGCFGLGKQYTGSSTARRGDSFDCCIEMELVIYYTS